MLIDGKKIASQVETEITQKVKRLPSPPHLAVILVGDDPASRIYAGKKQEAAKRVGIEFSLVKLKAGSSQNDVLKVIDALNNDPQVTGIIVQLPLPKALDEELIISRISLDKDVDGLNPMSRFNPAVVGAVLEVLKRGKAKIRGKHAVVVGAGRVAGLPIAFKLLREGATVTICHIRTKDLKFHTKQADILVSAVGKPHFITRSHVKESAVVIDVGISRKGGKVFGDVDPRVAKISSIFTPTPGGVGPLTVVKLLENTLQAYILQGIH